MRLCQLSLARPCRPRANRGAPRCRGERDGTHRGSRRHRAQPSHAIGLQGADRERDGVRVRCCRPRPRYGEGQSSAPGVTAGERNGPAAPMGAMSSRYGDIPAGRALCVLREVNTTSRFRSSPLCRCAARPGDAPPPSRGVGAELSATRWHHDRTAGPVRVPGLRGGEATAGPGGGTAIPPP